jgi:hypothetical protein
MKHSHLIVTKTLILTYTSTLTMDMAKTLLLCAVQVGAKFMFSQDSRILGILVLTILSLEVPVD